LDTLLCIVAAFGLFVIFVAKYASLLRLYVRFVYALLVLRSLGLLYVVITIASFRNDYMNFCKTNYYSNNVDESKLIRGCNISYISLLLGFIFLCIFVIITTIYFAMVINAYAERRQAKEEGVYVSSTVLEIAGSKPES
ncbi:6457_t:CDS:2, partial [Cetraspora pellucida]